MDQDLRGHPEEAPPPRRLMFWEREDARPTMKPCRQCGCGLFAVHIRGTHWEMCRICDVGVPGGPLKSLT